MAGTVPVSFAARGGRPSGDFNMVGLLNDPSPFGHTEWVWVGWVVSTSFREQPLHLSHNDVSPSTA